MPLLGHYPVDDEGMAPQRVDLVAKGKLKALLMSRVPTLKASGTNGHGRGTGRSVGWPGNLIVETDEPMSDEDLRTEFLDLCRDEGLEYGLVVRKLSSGTDRPRIAFRVYVEDGREVPARGLSFQSVTIQTLRDIVAAGETEHVYHSGGGATANSIVAPAIIVEEMDLRKPPPQRPKKPYMKHPSFEE
jgi:predicted Zn-dependent protease